jgi:hypothetical protein
MSSKPVAVELYRDTSPVRSRWRFSVREEPEAVACGVLRDIPGDASFVEAESALLAMLQADYGVRPTPRWVQDAPGWWTAALS